MLASNSACATERTSRDVSTRNVRIGVSVALVVVSTFLACSSADEDASKTPGIENPNAEPLKFVAFLYHST